MTPEDKPWDFDPFAYGVPQDPMDLLQCESCQ